MMATTALLLSADVSGALHLRPADPAADSIPRGNFPALSEPASADGQNSAPPKDDSPKPAQHPTKKVEALTPERRLELIRYVYGEYARVIQPIPASKKGIHIRAGAQVDESMLHIAVVSTGESINPGDKAQITSLDFKPREIVVGINGGGRGHTRWRDRIQIEADGVPTMSTTTSVPETPVRVDVGATIFLDFDGPLPNLTADELKHYLSALLDFSHQHSAALQWLDTLPPEIQTAIAERRPTVGMDHEMVLAALGRPDRKVREKEADGTETEDWIYGKPPAKTVFVKFEGDKVTQVEQFPQ